MTDELKNFFKEQGLTQKDLAEILGVSQPYIGMLLTGKKPFGKNTANIWSEKFGLSASWLLTGEGEMLKQGPTQIVSGQGAHHFTQTGDVEAAPDAAAQFSTIDRLIDELAAQRIMYQKLLEQQLEVFNKLAGKHSTDD